MSYTKGELVHQALNEIGIADYDFDIGAEQTESAMRRMDNMLAMWDTKGIKLGYPVAFDANGSTLDQNSNVPDSAVEAITTNLAIRIAPSYGKVVSIETKAIAKESLDVLFNLFATPPEMQLPSMPKGAGYKNIDYPYTPAPSDNLKDGDTAELDLEGVLNVKHN